MGSPIHAEFCREQLSFGYLERRDIYSNHRANAQTTTNQAPRTRTSPNSWPLQPCPRVLKEPETGQGSNSSSAQPKATFPTHRILFPQRAAERVCEELQCQRHKAAQEETDFGAPGKLERHNSKEGFLWEAQSQVLFSKALLCTLRRRALDKSRSSH